MPSYRLKKEELSRVLRKLTRLNSPKKIQDYLDKLPFNFEKGGETYRSPLQVMKNKEAHCFEGACFAVAALYLAGRKCYLIDLKVKDLKKDADHVLALFSEGNGKGRRWGAISKTNHGVLRWRDPIYLSVRELAASYFHEYFLNTTGEKTLVSYSAPFDIVRKFGTDWMCANEDLDSIADSLDKSKHYRFYEPSFVKYLRPASRTERRMGGITEWK